MTRRWLQGCVLVVIFCGCDDRGAPGGADRRENSPIDTVRTAAAMPQNVRDRLLDGAMSVLGHLEDYDEAAAFAQVFDRINQWNHALALEAGDRTIAWKLDPLLETLPVNLRSGAAETLASSTFDAVEDIPALRDQRWLADIAATARGDAIDDLDVAQKLFDWTVRSLAITSDPPMVPTEANPGGRWFLPGEILLSGRASGPQRAWIFLELLRHAGLDGVMLATGDAAAGVRPWIPALIAGGEAYLFEPTYGLAIPGPGGEGVATARQAASEPAILRGLDLPDRAYPIQAADMAELSVLVPATREQLARRMHLLDGRLAGVRRMDLAIDATDLGGRAVKALPGERSSGRLRIWEFPWETQRRRKENPAALAVAGRRELAVFSVALEAAGMDGARRGIRPLYAARLREFRGDLDGPDGAKAAYLLARPSSHAIAEALKQVPPGQVDTARRLYDRMKEDATYWLGILTLGEGEYETAVDYLGRMTLDAAPDGRWADAARVNLARAKLGLGDTAAAAALLRADASPQRFGSRILADRIGKTANPTTALPAGP